MKEETLAITGMSCMHCAAAVRRALELPGLTALEVTIGSARVKYDENMISRTQIVAAIEETGYHVV
ncbi:MAG TPA: cation transporter [bacterium]|nr:cation transporter [bacterium]HPR86874.1 cation transporter [bacterium]